MNLPEWSTVVAAVIAFFTGATWIGRQQTRISANTTELETQKKENAAAFHDLNEKMDEHTRTSADQWGQVQRALGRLEGHFGTRIVEKKDAG